MLLDDDDDDDDNNVGHGGSVVISVPCVRMVAGSNPIPIATLRPWASASLAVAFSASAC